MYLSKAFSIYTLIAFADLLRIINKMDKRGEHSFVEVE